MSLQGTVKFYNQERNYGFIKGDDGREFFVHVSDMNKSKIEKLRENQRVAFVEAAGKEGKGPRATEIKAI